MRWHRNHYAEAATAVSEIVQYFTAAEAASPCECRGGSTSQDRRDSSGARRRRPTAVGFAPRPGSTMSLGACHSWSSVAAAAAHVPRIYALRATKSGSRRHLVTTRNEGVRDSNPRVGSFSICRAKDNRSLSLDRSANGPHAHHADTTAPRGGDRSSHRNFTIAEICNVGCTTRAYFK